MLQNGLLSRKNDSLRKSVINLRQYYWFISNQEQNIAIQSEDNNVFISIGEKKQLKALFQKVTLYINNLMKHTRYKNR